VDEEELRYEDARHIDHQALREELREEFKGRPPGERTVEINGQRYRLFTMKEWLASANQPVTRWEAFELMALFYAARQYESWWARTFRRVARFLNRLGAGIEIPAKKTDLKVPIGRIERRSS